MKRLRKKMSLVSVDNDGTRHLSIEDLARDCLQLEIERIHYGVVPEDIAREVESMMGTLRREWIEGYKEQARSQIDLRIASHGLSEEEYWLS